MRSVLDSATKEWGTEEVFFLNSHEPRKFFVRAFLLMLSAALVLTGCTTSSVPIGSDSGNGNGDKTETSEFGSSCTSENDVASEAFAYRDGGIRGDQHPCELQDAAMHLSSLGANVPKLDPEFHLLYGDAVTEEMRADYLQWMDILIETLGGYDRWVHAIYDVDSSSAENSEVVRGLEQLGFFEFGWDGPQEPSIDAVWKLKGCLSDFFSGPNFLIDSYNFCNQPEHWSDPDRQFDREMMGDLYFSYEILHEFAHEYHHHVQRAHELSKEGSFGNGPGAPLPPDGFAPTWYIEGSAGVSPGWILRDYFDELYLSQRLGLTYEKVRTEDLAPQSLIDNYLCPSWSINDFQERSPGPGGFRVSKAQEVYSVQQMDVFGYEEPDGPWGCMNLYLMHLTSPRTLFVSILQDQWTLGWHGSFKKHTGLTMDEFYAEFEQEMMSIDLSNEEDLPSWTYLPEEKFVDAVDYWSIESGPSVSP